MKFIATSDWHIGNMFHGNDRLPEHRHFFNWLLDRIQEEKPDALLVAGDIFDNGNPSAAAQSLYYGFLAQLAKRAPEVKVIITAGNHDSANRLEAPRTLLENFNVIIRGNIKRRWMPVAIESEEVSKKGEWVIDYDDLIIPVDNHCDERMVVCAIPYLRGDILGNRMYSEGVNTFLERIYNRARELHPGAPIVMMTHMYATGAEIADKEASERILVGGEEEVMIEKCKIAPDYMTCGHIHKRQKIRGLSNARYTGSVLPFSFAEKDYKHGVDLVTLNPNTAPEVRQIIYEPQHKLRVIPENDDELSPQEVKKIINKELNDRENGNLTDNFDYVAVKVVMKNNNADIVNEIERLFEDKDAVLCKLTRIMPGINNVTLKNETILSVDDILERKPMDILEEAYSIKHNRELSDSERALLKKIFV